MTVIIQLIATALLGGFFGAYFTHLYTRQVENQKVARTRQAVGTVIQAELAHFHLQLSDHHRNFDGYRRRVTGIVGGTTKADFPKMEIGERFSSVYQNTIPEIGLFDTETSYGVVYCYSNIFRLMRDQENLIVDLDGLINSSMLGHRVQNLFDHEAALLQQIERIMSRLKKQSRAIPFTPTGRTDT